MLWGKRGRIVAAAIVASLTLLTACGGSSESRDRNVFTLIGQSCRKPGAIKKVGGVSYVCGHIRKAKPKQGIYYGVAAVKNWKCVKLGTSRYQNGIFSVCSGGAKASSRKWALTVPVPVGLVVGLERDEATAYGALEAAAIPVPEEFAKLPKSMGNLVEASTTIATPSSTSGVIGTVAGSTSSLQSPVSQPGSPTTGVQPNDLETPTTVGVDSTVATTVVAPGTTASSSPPTSAGSIIPSATTVTPTTAPRTSTTETTTVAVTDAPASTSAVTTVAPTVPATTTAPITVAPTEPPTTAEATTVVPTTAAPPVIIAKLTCATGGKCAPGDRGPAGGTVVLVGPGNLIEVAPVTWYVRGEVSELVPLRLTYGNKNDWRMPTSDEMVRIRTSRGLFRCPNSKRCALGFANAKYWSNGQDSIQTVDFAGVGPAEDAAIRASHYIRPVRSLVGVQLNTELGPS